MLPRPFTDLINVKAVVDRYTGEIMSSHSGDLE